MPVVKRVFIDPGHGGSDPGAVKYAVEKEVVLAIALELGAILKKYGVTVAYSRTSNSTAVGLSERASMANRWGAELFISIHANSSAGTASGTETFAYNNANNETRQIGTNIVNIMAKEMNLKNRGLKFANFSVLRRTNMSALLVETGFVNSTYDAEKLKNNPRGFAVSMAKAILVDEYIEEMDGYDTNDQYHREIKYIDGTAEEDYMKGEDVKKVQYKLNLKGIKVVGVLGAFGPRTEEGVKLFQKQQGLTVDGIVRKDTWDKLMDKSVGGYYDGNDEYHRMIKVTDPNMMGADVKRVQTRLNSKISSNLTVDAAYREVTEAEVVKFQQKNNLTVDGVIGPNTWMVLVKTPDDGGSGDYDQNGAYHRVLKLTDPLMAGEDVKKVQASLNSKASAGLAVDGYFGKGTEKAVKDYQNKNILDANGKVDELTWNSLMNGSSGGDDDYDPNGDYHRLLSLESPFMAGEDIKNVQKKLNDLNLSNLDTDGIFGSSTDSEVRKFQSKNGLVVDGVVGPATWDNLMNGEPEGGYDPNGEYHRLIEITKPLTKGEDVKNVQKALNKKIGSSLSLDGVYGQFSEKEVIKFQQKNNLDVDGVVGSSTWEKLMK